MASIPKTSAHFSTSLASKITSSASSMTLVSGTDKAGNALSGLYGFVLDKGSASEEFLLGTVSGTTVTITARGLDPGDGKTEVTALKLPHRRGATVDITDYPILAILARILNGDEAFPNDLNLGSKKLTSLATPSASTDAANKGYVDGVAIAGGVDASNSNKGISKLSTAPVSSTNPISVGDNDGRVPTQSENDALAATNSPSSSNLFITQKDFQKGAEISGSTTGSANAYVFTPSPAIAAYAAGMTFRLKANFTNTGAATLNVSGLGAVAIKKLDGATALVAGDIVSGQEFVVIYDGTNVQMVSPVGNAAGATIKTNVTTTDVTVGATGTETTIFSATVTGGTLGTNGAVRGTLSFSFTTAANTTKTLKLKYGGTTIATISLTRTGSTSFTYNGYINFMVLGAGGTSSQEGSVSIYGDSGFAIDSNAPVILMGEAIGTAAADSTSNQTLALTWQHNSGGDSFTMNHGAAWQLI